MRAVLWILAAVAGVLGVATPQAQAFLEQLGQSLG